MMKRRGVEKSSHRHGGEHRGLFGVRHAGLKHCLRLPLRVALRLHDEGVTSYIVALALLSQFLLLMPQASALGRAARAVEPRPVLKRAAPTQTTETVIVFGPRRFDRTGPLTRESAQFTLPNDVVAPFTLQVQNGAPDGTGRVLLGSVKLNGAVVFGSGEIGPQTPTLAQTVTPAALNRLEVSFFGRKDSFLTVTVAARRVVSGTPPSITDFSPKKGVAGATVSLAGSSLSVDAGETTVTFAGKDGTRKAALVSNSTQTEVRVTVPNGAVTGLVELTTPFGRASTGSTFTVEAEQNFDLTVAPTSAAAVQRGTATQIISVTSPQSDFTQLVRLSASGLPARVKAQFEPSQITAGASSTLTLILSDVDLAPGSYPFTIGGKTDVNGRELAHDATATLNVAAMGQTTLTGQVLSTDKEPILGATVSLDGKTSTTDAAGIFFLSGITAGTARPLMINGGTASAPNRNYPLITEPANVVAGQANVVPFIFYLPPIDTQFDTEVVPGQNTVAGNPRVEGLAMTVPAGANLRNRDGSPVSRVSITPLEPDRTPAPLPSNVATPVVYTSQPGGALTDIPTPVVYPNLAGANPGTRIELYAFNHDTVKWYVYGFGRVTPDGRSITPEVNPQTGRPYGLLDFSWHFPNVSPSGNPGDDGGCGGGRTAHPVDLATGLKIETTTDISISGARGRLELTRVFTTDLAQSCDTCPFGRGATHNYAIRLSGSFTQGGAGRVILPEQLTGRLFSYAGTASGGVLLFTPGGVVSQAGDVLRKLSDGTYEYRYSHGGLMRFNSAGRLTALADRNGNTTTLTYTGSSLTRIADAVGRSITLAYDSSGRVTSATDPLGRVWHYTYEGTPGVAGGPGLTTVRDPLDNVTRYTYVTGGRLASITAPRGNVVKRITYDANGRAVSQQFADGGIERYAYELAGSVVSAVTVTDALGRRASKRFNANGYVIESVDALGQHSKIERDINTNLPLATVGPCGCPEVTRQFDDRGNITSVTDRLGQQTKIEYEPTFNNVTKITDALGRVTSFAYDGRGNLVTVNNALGRTTTFAYDGFGELTGITDPLGHARHIEYDASGNITAIADALSERVTLEYDGAGRLTALLDPLTRRTAFEYDAADRVTALTDAAGSKTTFDYDANGNRTGTTDALGHKWGSEYDSKDRMTSRTDPLGRVMRMEYNRGDEELRLISPSGRVTAFTYDARGQVASITDPLGAVVNFAYDNRGNLTTLTDERGNVTNFVYDELYRLITTRDPLGQTSLVKYDAVGNVTESIDRLGRRTTYTRDALNRMTGAAYQDAQVTYAYDAAGRMTSVNDTQSGTVQWSYDEADRLLSETTPAGLVRYVYNAAGQRTSMTAADRPAVTYGYDAAGRLSTVKQGPETFTYTYDTLSRLAGLQRPNGVRTAFGYDTVNRLERLSHLNGASQFVEDYRYAYNADGEIEHLVPTASAQLLPAAKQAGTADAANRVTQFDQASYTFDAEGETTSRTDAQGTTQYGWDARGRLTRATLPGGQTVGYAYDALGRRASRTASGQTTSFLYDGADVVLDRSGDAVTSDYLNGAGIDNKLRQSSASTGALYFLQDHLGSTAFLTNAGGGVVESEQYEAFGASAGSALTRYGYTGRERDPATGLLFYRARWYDPHQGHFLSEDPLGLRGGLNLYLYVRGNPLNYYDPLGLSTFQLGVSGNIQIGPININGGFGLAADGHGGLAFYSFSGGGGGAGADAFLGVSALASNADRVCQLGGLFYDGSVDAGLEVAGSVEGFVSPDGKVSGVGLSVGVGAGADWAVTGTYTNIVPLNGAARGR